MTNVFQKVKEVTKKPVGIKININGYNNRQLLTPQSSAQFIATLKPDFVELTSGNDVGTKFARLRPKSAGAYYLERDLPLFMAYVKNYFQDNPRPLIICTGGFENIVEASKCLLDGADMAGFGRKFLRNPLFLKDYDTQKCTKCNQCQSSGKCMLNW